MASVCDTSMPASNSTDDCTQLDEQAVDSSCVGEALTEVKDRSNSASFDDQNKKTREVFEDLRNAVIESTKALETSFSRLKAKEERFTAISRKISSINFESTIKLNVGGSIYQTSLETLTKHPESLLAEMFSTCFKLKQGNDGCYFIDRDGTYFRHILNYLRSGKTPVPSILKMDLEEILNEAEYYGLAGLVKAIKAKLNGDDDCSSENVKEEGEIPGSDLVEETRKELCRAEKKLSSFLNLLDANIKVLDEAISHHKEVSTKLSSVHFGEHVEITVGGKIFTTSLKTLRRESGSVLALMFSEKFDLKKEDNGSFFIDRDGTFFHHVLNYLRDGEISEDVIEVCGVQIQREAEFYGLSGLKKQIHNFNHVKLNVGDANFEVTREVLKKYPDSMFGRIVSGKECAFKRRHDGSFYVERDGTNFHHILEYLESGTISDNVIKDCGLSLCDDAAFYRLPGLKEQINNYHNVKVNVGGREFVASRKVLNNFPGSLFCKMLSGEEGDYVKRSDGCYFIQQDGTCFHHILNYLRSGTLSDGVIGEHSALLCDDAEFYVLPGLKERINNYHNVKMKVSVRDFVVGRRLLNRFPDSLFGKMLAGEKGDYVRRDDGSYLISHNSSRFQHIVEYLKSETLSDDIIEQYSGYLLADANFFMLSGLVDRINNYHNVKLNVGGREFVVNRMVLKKFPESLFGKMLAGEKGGYVKRNDGSYIIQHDSTNFHLIYSYLISGQIPSRRSQSFDASFCDEALFYGLQQLKGDFSRQSKGYAF